MKNSNLDLNFDLLELQKLFDNDVSSYIYHSPGKVVFLKAEDFDFVLKELVIKRENVDAFYDGKNNSAFKRSVNDGGTSLIGLAYLTNGQGAIKEEMNGKVFINLIHFLFHILHLRLYKSTKKAHSCHILTKKTVLLHDYKFIC